MGVFSSTRNTLDRIENFICRNLVRYSERKNIKKKDLLIKKISLSVEEQAEIDRFFSKYYGKKVPYHWHKLYQSYTGRFNVDYFPEILFSTELELLTNPKRKSELLGDKNLLTQLFGNVYGLHIPKTYLSCVESFVRDEKNHHISVCNAESVFAKLDCVVKKTVDTSSGRDIYVCSFKDGIDIKSKKSYKDILELFGKNYIVQEKIVQCNQLNILYPYALNTFRIMTFITNDGIKVCPLSLRLARGGADRDNIHFGGIVIGINQDGTLKEEAFSEMGERFFSHPDTGIVFKNFQIPNINMLVETAVHCHECIPWLGVLSWDFSLDSKDTPVLIEVNTYGQSAWFPQMTNGEALFGKYTGEMLEKIKR